MYVALIKFFEFIRRGEFFHKLMELNAPFKVRFLFYGCLSCFYMYILADQKLLFAGGQNLI